MDLSPKTSFTRTIVVGLCLATLFAVTPVAADALTPRWYVKETGGLVPFSGKGGLIELTSPESVQSMGGLTVMSASDSECLSKDRETLENPSETSSPGKSKTREFEIVCEEGTGARNTAAPFPCVTGEAFELKGVGLPWSSTLEAVSTSNTKPGKRIGDGPSYYDKSSNVDIEADCLRSKKRAEYVGSLRPEVSVGRLRFLGPESGELEDAASGSRLYFKGEDFITPEKYKDVRVDSDYSEGLAITSLTPNSGPASGGNHVSILGNGFALGTETSFAFGTAVTSGAECPSTTECTVTAPAGESGRSVKVTATVGRASSKETSASKYSYK